MRLSKRTYWSTVAISASFLALSYVKPVAHWIGKPFLQWFTVGGYFVFVAASVGLLFAYFVSSSDTQSIGGKGGTGTASGVDSTALGGDGGRGGVGQGGDGGDGLATGRGSYAQGGKGGDG